MAHKHKSTLRL